MQWDRSIALDTIDWASAIELDVGHKEIDGEKKIIECSN